MYRLDNPVARRRVRLGSPRLASLAFLGATTSTPPEAASSASAAAAMQSLNIPQNDAYYNWTLDAIEQGELPDYEPGVLTGTAVQFQGGTAGCSSNETSSSKAALVSAIGGAGTGVTSALATAGVITAPVLPLSLALLGASAIISGIASLFNHHAQAVAKERGTLCAAVPAANASLQQLSEYYVAGQISAATYVQGLNQTLSQFQSFTSAISSSVNWTGGTCNEGCIYNRALKGIVAKLTADLSAAAASGAGGEAIASSGGLLVPALVLVGAYLLLA